MDRYPTVGVHCWDVEVKTAGLYLQTIEGKRLLAALKASLAAGKPAQTQAMLAYRGI